MLKDLDSKNNLDQNFSYSLMRLGLKCNANCLFCNVPYEKSSGRNPSLKETNQIIKKISAYYKDPRLVISGGEPTLIKNLEKIIGLAFEEGIKDIQLQTNGILLSDLLYVEKLKAAGLKSIFVGFHSHVPAIHDKLMGVKGAFKKCIQGINNATKTGLEVILNPVVTILNYKELPEFVNFIKSNFPSVGFISLSVIQPRGRAWTNRYLVPRYKTISPFVTKMLKEGKRNRLVINNPYCGLPLCIGGWHHYLEHCAEYYESLSMIKNGTKNRYVNKDKVKAAQCSICDLNYYCNGVWKEYADIYSFSDLHPIKK